MAVVIDATVSGVSSNCYVTLARGNTLLAELPHAADLVADQIVDRSQLFVHATRLIDRYLQFDGSKTVTTQALSWPRVGIVHHITGDAVSSLTIPDFVEWAVVEWANLLYQDSTIGTNIAPGLTRLRTPSYDIELSGARKGTTPQVVMDLLLPYGDRTPVGMIRLMRA